MSLALRSRFGPRDLPATAAPPGEVVLTQRVIYILPTRAGVVFAGTAVLMLTGCINYDLGLGFVLTFLVSAIGIVSILHTFGNLARLRIAPGRPRAVFAGDDAVFPVLLSGQGSLQRYAIGLRAAAQLLAFVDVPPLRTTRAEVRLPATRRGSLPLGRIEVLTTFPLGLFRAWSSFELDSHCLVYPKPESGQVPFPPAQAGDSGRLEAGQGQDDFSGLRKYHAGDSLRHVAWKAAARGQPMMTKQFTGPAAGEIWLDWSDLPPGMGTEQRLSRLTRWVLDAGRAGETFGLRIPSIAIAPASGLLHEEQCLAALALFGT
ncbi:MAG TPA: DUF58 domain-containing protein [Burkholderiales bacterium]|nr:DUF58 domain-containing protein [Burkholderiales bacterium]